MLVYDGTSDIYPTTQRFRTHLGLGMRRLFTELRIACECTAYTDEGHFENMENTWLYKRLPPAMALQLDEPFIENLMASHLSLAFKTFAPEPAGVACLAETFLLVWSTEWAVFLNHSSGTLQSDCDTFIGAAIGDFDHEFLDAPQADGIHLIEDLGVASSAKEQWFKPFNRPTDITHPFTWPNDKHYIFENWDHLK